MPRVDRFLLVLISAAGLLAGCGGDSEGGGRGSEETDYVRDIQPEAQARAETLVLELSDFPEGWRASPAEDEDADDDEYQECVGVDFSGVTLIGKSTSQDFANGESTEISSGATVFDTERDAEEALTLTAATLGGVSTEDCFVERLQDAQNGQDYEIGEVDLGELGFRPPDVEEAKAFQVTMPLEAGGFQETFYFEFFILREGDTVTTLETSERSAPFDPALRDDLLMVLADRMAGS